MKVRELIEWLQAFEDQEATVRVLHCESGSGYYQQGGVTHAVEFSPEDHVDYSDFRGNKFVEESSPWYNSRTILLGLNEG